MAISNTLKTGALALALVLTTVSGAFAGTAWADQDTKLKSKAGAGTTLAYIDEGDKLWVSKCKQGFCQVKYDGKSGWVKYSALDFHQGYKGGWDDDDADVSFCIGGNHGSFCVSN